MVNRISIGMLTLWLVVTLLVGGLAGYFIGEGGSDEYKNGGSIASGAPTAISKAETLRTTMRKLWADHVVWTRDYIIAAAAGAPDTQAASARLLKNQEDIGNAVASYYGSEAGKQATDLLKEHILIAVDLVSAAKAGDTAKQQDADTRWHTNAEDIAVFLSEANPNWDKDEMLEMLNEHLSLTTDEAVNRLTKKWDADVSNFDNIFKQSQHMADMLSAGIIKQFPQKF